MIGAGALLTFVVLLLSPRELGFSVKAGATYRALWEQEILQQPLVDLALAEPFEQRRQENAKVVGQLVSFLGLALGALTLETAGTAKPVGLYGVEVCRDTIRRVTDAVLEDLAAWRSRPQPSSSTWPSSARDQVPHDARMDSGAWRPQGPLSVATSQLDRILIVGVLLSSLD